MSQISPFSSLQVVRVCVHAEKRMSTLKMALHLPVTICTLIMLVSLLSLSLSLFFSLSLSLSLSPDVYEGVVLLPGVSPLRRSPYAGLGEDGMFGTADCLLPLPLLHCPTKRICEHETKDL